MKKGRHFLLDLNRHLEGQPHGAGMRETLGVLDSTRAESGAVCPLGARGTLDQEPWEGWRRRR